MKDLLRSFYYRVFRTPAFYIELGVLCGLMLLEGGLMLAVTWIPYLQGITINAGTKAQYILSSFTGGSVSGFSSTMILDVKGLAILILTGFHYFSEFSSGSAQAWVGGGKKRKDIHRSLFLGNLSYAAILHLSSTLCLLIPFLFLPVPWGFEFLAPSTMTLHLFLLLLYHLGWYAFSFFCWNLLTPKKIGVFLPMFVLLGTAMAYGFAAMLALLWMVGDTSTSETWYNDFMHGLTLFFPPTQLGFLDAPSTFDGPWGESELEIFLVLVLESLLLPLPCYFLGRLVLEKKDFA